VSYQGMLTLQCYCQIKNSSLFLTMTGFKSCWKIPSPLEKALCMSGINLRWRTSIYWSLHHSLDRKERSNAFVAKTPKHFWGMFCLLVEVARFYPFSYTPPHKARMLASDEKIIYLKTLPFPNQPKTSFCIL